MLHEYGREIKHDFAKATDLFYKSCRLDLWAGCSEQGLLYEDGKVVACDYRHAVIHYEKGGCHVVDGRMKRLAMLTAN